MGLKLDPAIPAERRIIIHGNVRVWGEAVKLQATRVMGEDTYQTQRHIDAALFAIALLRFEESVQRAIREYANVELKHAFKQYRSISPSTRRIRNALHYILDNSLALPAALKKTGIPPREWSVGYEKRSDDFVIRVARQYELSVAKAAAATGAIVAAL